MKFGQSMSHYFSHYFSELIFVSHHYIFLVSWSMESTTPMIALSIAAPASPVEAVEADQPS
jgi:hypothetical protein